jgi:CHAD domain-containing protein
LAGSTKAAGQSASPATVILLADSNPATAVGQTLRTAAEALAQNHAGAMAGQPEAVHQFRISTRKLRAALELFRPLFDERSFNLYRGELKVVGHTVGGARDSDVLAQTLSRAEVKIEPSMREALAPIHNALDRQRDEQRGKSSALLASKRYDLLIERLTAATARKIAEPETAPSLHELLEGLVRKVEKAGAKLAPDSPPTRFHRLRIRIKRLRYALEMIWTDELKSTSRTIKRLKKLQDVIGAQHDSLVAIGWLREFDQSEAHPRESLLAAGALFQVEYRRSLKFTRRAWKRWKKFQESGIIRQMLREVAHFERASAHRETVRAA